MDSLSGTAGKFGAIAQAAEQAASTVQSLQKGGAQALLAPVGQAAMAKVAGGTTALGLQGWLPRIGAEVLASIPKKSVT
jgi:type VI secretion system secreted protein VgrG